MFVQMDDGNLLNSNEIVRINRLNEDTRGGSITEWFAFTKNNVRLGLMSYEISRLISEGSLLPSRPSDKVVIVTFEDDGKYEVGEYPILGWRVIEGRDDELTAMPILLEERATNQQVGILLSDGRVVLPSISEYPNIEEFAQDQARRYFVNKRVTEVENSTKLE
jgi:hypothetical protein